MTSSAPLIAVQDRDKLLTGLTRQLPGYLAGWQPADPANSAVLMRIFARYLEILAGGLNQVPERSLMAFLDMLGTHLLPAQAATAPLVFSLLDNAPIDVTLPAGSRVAALAQPAAPSPLPADRDQTPAADVIFSTRQTVTLARAHLAALYSINPGSDEYVDHSADLTKGLTLFDNMSLTEHSIYLGHDELFALGGEEVIVMLSFSLERYASRELKTKWDYLTEGGWSPLESLPEDDTTQGMKRDGLILLHRDCAPKAKQDTLPGLTETSYWLRGSLTTPLLPDGGKGERTVPVINDIRARVGFTRSGIAPEAAFLNGVPLDVSKDFYPFGQQPVTFTTFYLACKEVFQRKGAQVSLAIELSVPGKSQGPLQLAWEYHDGTTWNPLTIQSSAGSAGTFKLTSSGTVAFSCPSNWTENSVNGLKNYWLRVRIIQGTYGYPARMNLANSQRTINEVKDNQGFMVIALNSAEGYNGGEQVKLTKPGLQDLDTIVAYRQNGDEIVLTTPIPQNQDFKNGFMNSVLDANGNPKLLTANLRPPVISKITLAFTYLTDPFELDHVLSVNDFVVEDHTEDARWPNRTFTPFLPVADAHPTIHFGFDNRLPVGLVSMYVNAQEEADDSSKGSPFVWEYRSERGWTELGVLDETLGFRRSGLIQFIGPPDATAAMGLNGELFRVRARLKHGESMQPLPVSGVWLNAIWADQRTAPEREELGASDGNPGQTFSLRRSPVLEGEAIEIQEWIGRGEGWRTTLNDVPENELRKVSDPVTNQVTSVWVTWHAQPQLYDSHASDRHYTIERATGLIRFGDHRNGLIPPAGSRIVATYSSGGGAAGNVSANIITELRTALPFLQSATNPMPASGGAEVETTTAVKRRGPQRLCHHDRGVSAEDCEWLAREASPDVARVHCLPLTGSAGRAQRGWITLVVVPSSPDAQPQPSPEFHRRVREHLAQRVPVAVSRHVRIVGPQYVLVGVQAEIIPHVPSQAAQVEARVRDKLNRFLHPLAGGTDGDGWSFGQAVYLSQVARVIEETVGVNYAREIRLHANGQVFADVVPIEADALVAAGDHELKLSIGTD